jgi:prepilin signal peptidase PulO-like enzyme (type II secretory pathway)
MKRSLSTAKQSSIETTPASITAGANRQRSTPLCLRRPFHSITDVFRPTTPNGGNSLATREEFPMTADTLFAVAEPPQRRPWGEALAVSSAVVALYAVTHVVGLPTEKIGGAAGLMAGLMIAVSTVTDFKWCRIFNWTTYLAFGWAVAFGIVADLYGDIPIYHGGSTSPLAEVIGIAGLSQVLAGFAVCFGAMFAMFFVFGGGAGDVKFIAVLGALVGWEGGLYTWVYGCIAAAIFTIGVALVRVGPKTLLAELLCKFGLFRLSMMLGGPRSETKQLFRRRIPMGPFFAIGAIAVALSH